MEVKQLKTVDEILSMDTARLSLEDMIAMLKCKGEHFADDIMKLRIRHEEDTGIPMEEDSISVQEDKRMINKFHGIYGKLN